MDFIKIIPVVFYREDSGSEPVREWLLEQSIDDRKAIGRDIRIVQLDWPVGPPLVKSIGNKIWEIRTRLENKIARVFFIFHEGNIILIHGFIKKTQKIPLKEVEIAKKTYS